MLDVSAPSATSTSAVADVEVAVNPVTARAVACNASNGIFSVAVAPGSFLLHTRLPPVTAIAGGCDAEPEGHGQRHRGGVAMALIAVAADKGAPGVTTTALALAAVWPRPVLLAECDPAGGDLVYRFPAAAVSASTRAAGCSASPWPLAVACSRTRAGSTPRS